MEKQSRLNTADIILASVAQSQDRLHFEDFTPLPCGDPNCATIGYLLKTPLGVRSISDFVDFAQIAGISARQNPLQPRATSRNAAANPSRSATCSSNSKWMKPTPFAFSSNRSWTHGRGTKIGLIVAART